MLADPSLKLDPLLTTPVEKMIGSIAQRELGKWLEEADMKAIVQKLDELGIQAEDLDEKEAYKKMRPVILDYLDDKDFDTDFEPHETDEAESRRDLLATLLDAGKPDLANSFARAG